LKEGGASSIKHLKSKQIKNRAAPPSNPFGISFKSLKRKSINLYVSLFLFLLAGVEDFGQTSKQQLGCNS
jgi:hypothetical protein